MSKMCLLKKTPILCILTIVLSVIIELVSYYAFEKPIGVPVGLQNGVEMQIEMYMCLGGFLYRIVHEFDSGVISYFHTFRFSVFLFEVVLVFIVSFMLVFGKQCFDSMFKDGENDAYLS